TSWPGPPSPMAATCACATAAPPSTCTNTCWQDWDEIGHGRVPADPAVPIESERHAGRDVGRLVPERHAGRDVGRLVPERHAGRDVAAAPVIKLSLPPSTMSSWRPGASPDSPDTANHKGFKTCSNGF